MQGRCSHRPSLSPCTLTSHTGFPSWNFGKNEPTLHNSWKTGDLFSDCKLVFTKHFVLLTPQPFPFVWEIHQEEPFYTRDIVPKAYEQYTIAKPRSLYHFSLPFWGIYFLNIVSRVFQIGEEARNRGQWSFRGTILADNIRLMTFLADTYSYA